MAGSQKAWLLRRRVGVAQKGYVGDNVEASDAERLAVGGELKRANLIRREACQSMTRRAIERLSPNVTDAVLAAWATPAIAPSACAQTTCSQFNRAIRSPGSGIG